MPTAGTAISPGAASNGVGPPGYALVHVLPRGTGYVNAIACAPDGSLLAVASDDGRVTLWDTHSGTMLNVLHDHKGPVYAVAISADGATIATAGLDETIRLSDLHSGRERHTMTGHQGWINAVAFSPDGRTLVSAGRDRTVRTWDVDSGKILQSINFPSEVFTVATDPQGQLFASDKGNSFSIHDINSGKEISDGISGQWGINTVLFSPGGQQLISAGYDGVIWLWNIREAKLDHHIQVEGSPIISLATTGKGSLVAALCSGNGTVVLYDTANWNELGRLAGVTYPVGSVVFSADGNTLAAGGGDSPVRIWGRSDR